MFVDWKEGPVPPQWPPAPRKPKPRRQEKFLLWLIGLNLLLLFVGPFAGSSVILAIAAMLGN